MEVLHDHKTVSYWVGGPLAMGAALAGASPEERSALERFARPGRAGYRCITGSGAVVI